MSEHTPEPQPPQRISFEFLNSDVVRWGVFIACIVISFWANGRYMTKEDFGKFTEKIELLRKMEAENAAELRAADIKRAEEAWAKELERTERINQTMTSLLTAVSGLSNDKTLVYMGQKLTALESQADENMRAIANLKGQVEVLKK